MVLTRDIVQELAWNNAETITSVMLQDYTEIGDFAFMDCTSLMAITIPSTITKIGKCAFKRCSSLVKDAGTRQRLITIPNSVTEIGEGAFKSCYNLERVNLQCSIDQLDDELFSCCVRLKSVTGIPSGVTRIGKECFEFCQCLTAITLPTTVTSIDDEAFANCIRLYAINGIAQTDITRVGLNAFYNCIGLTSITLPGTVTEIGDFAFDGSGLTAPLKVNNATAGKCILAFIPKSTQGALDNTILSGVTDIIGGAFSRCTEITFIKLPSTLVSIGVSAFEYCSKLASIDASDCDNLNSVGNHAFYGCNMFIRKFKNKPTIGNNVTAYKGFYYDMTCRDGDESYKYNVNNPNTYSGTLEMCESGFHSCLNPLDCFNYYYTGKVKKKIEGEVELNPNDLVIDFVTPENGDTVWLTFDNIGSNRTESTMYISGTVEYDSTDRAFKLINVSYHGLLCDSGSTINGETLPNGAIIDRYIFENITDTDGNPIDMSYIQCWEYIQYRSQWVHNSEFEFVYASHDIVFHEVTIGGVSTERTPDDSKVVANTLTVGRTMSLKQMIQQANM